MGGGTLMAAGVGGWNIAIMNPPRHSHLYSSAYFPNPGSYNYSNKTHHQHRSVGCKAAAAGHQPAKKSSSDEKWVAKGVITESLPNGMFWVRLENNGVGVVLGYVSGKIRRNSIRMLPGDCVNIELTRYDSTRGRIVYRLPSTQPNNHPAAKHS